MNRFKSIVLSTLITATSMVGGLAGHAQALGNLGHPDHHGIVHVAAVQRMGVTDHQAGLGHLGQGQPETGELILFAANRVHAVRAIRSGTRVTVSCFIGFRGRFDQLFLWS